MNKPLMQELLKLTPAERIELINELWDSIPPAEQPPLTEAQKVEVDRRIAEHERNPSRASSWEDVEARLKARFE